jgi:predicted nucleic acid-binding protein
VTTAFWDTSALVPLCVQQQPSAAVQQLVQQYEISVWWGTAVEMRSAFERLLRMGQLTAAEYAAAASRLGMLRRSWRELQPSEALRSKAEAFLMQYPLKAADSLQLAAAWTWCAGSAKSRVLILANGQLMAAARQVGFQVVTI